MRKNKIIILASLAVLFLLSACNQAIDDFDTQKENFIYFDMPFMLNDFGKPTTDRNTIMFYSFDLDELSVKEHIFKVPINIIGMPTDNDRAYKVEVVTDKTTATDADWDKSAINNLTVKGGAIRDTIYLKVNRTPILKTEEKTIVLRMIPTDNFSLGYTNLLEITINFSDQLIPPVWWNKWIRILGDFSREKYNKWKEIYYLGADPNVETLGPGAGKPLYYDNMPYYTTMSWYPSTAMFIRMLKQYFIDHEVYPDGDTTKPRISVPFNG